MPSPREGDLGDADVRLCGRKCETGEEPSENTESRLEGTSPTNVEFAQPHNVSQEPIDVAVSESEGVQSETTLSAGGEPGGSDAYEKGRIAGKGTRSEAKRRYPLCECHTVDPVSCIVHSNTP